MKDKGAAEDVVQDVFVMLFEKGFPVEEDEELKAFLYVVVRNRCLDHIKHLKIVEKYQQGNEEKEPSQDSILASICLLYTSASFFIQNLVSEGGTFIIDGTTGVKCTSLSGDSATRCV